MDSMPSDLAHLKMKLESKFRNFDFNKELTQESNFQDVDRSEFLSLVYANSQNLSQQELNRVGSSNFSKFLNEIKHLNNLEENKSDKK